MTTSAVQGQSSEPDLIAAVLGRQKYVVGQDNPPVGVFIRGAEADDWRRVAPSNMRCFDIAVDARGTLYAAAGNGLLRTFDLGQHWRIATDWRMTEVMTVEISPNDASLLYIGTAYGIWRSPDAGASWQEISEGLKDTYVSDVWVHPDEPGKLLAATESGVFASTNGGDKWKRVGLEGVPVHCLVNVPGDPNVVCAGVEEAGVFISENGGKSWQAMDGGLENRSVFALAFDPATPEIILAGTYQSGVYRSSDGGRSWARKSPDLDLGTVHALAIHPQRRGEVYAGTIGGGAFRSTDGGERWEFFGLEGASVWNLGFWPKDGD